MDEVHLVEHRERWLDWLARHRGREWERERERERERGVCLGVDDVDDNVSLRGRHQSPLNALLLDLVRRLSQARSVSDDDLVPTDVQLQLHDIARRPCGRVCGWMDGWMDG